MPVEENGAPGTATTNPMGSSQQPGAISDLGDILLDKSLDTMQKNDFVAVTKNDVAGLGGGEEEEDNDPFARPAPVQDSTPLPVVEHATIEDLQNIMLEEPTNESPFSDQTPAEPKEVETAPTTNNDFDLGDISTPPVVETIPEPVVESAVEPVVATNEIASTVNNNDFDLGDISTPTVVEAVVEPVVESVVAPVEAPVGENSGSSLDFDLGDIGTQTNEVTSEAPTTTDVVEEVVVEESTPANEVAPTTEDVNNLDFDLGDVGADTNAVVEEVAPTEEEVVQETDNSSIDLGSLENMIPENTVDTTIEQTETPVETQETPAETNQDIVIDTSSLETPTDVVVEDVPVVENNIPTESVVEISPETIVSEEATPVNVETPISEVPTTTDVGSALDGLENTVQTEAVPQPSSNPEAVALEKVADDITQGIDLDSLMVDTPTVAAAAQVADEATAKQTPTEGLKAMFSGSNGNQKKVLIGLGAFALIGLIYFGYVLMADSSPSVPTPEVTAQVVDTGDTMDEVNDDVVVDEVVTGSTDESNGDVVVDDIATGDTLTDTGSMIDTGSTQPVAKTPAEILASAKDLGGQVRKALIKATIMKNAQMRLSAFGLQKDVETFIQTLENSNDMTTVSDSETKLNSLSQRLDSILQKLDGSSQ